MSPPKFQAAFHRILMLRYDNDRRVMGGAGRGTPLSGTGWVKIAGTLVAVVTLGVSALRADDGENRRNLSLMAGSYRVSVVVDTAGGGGTATVGAGTVTINADVEEAHPKAKKKKSKGGKKGKFEAQAQQTPSGHFKGVGTLMGQPVEILDGRVDPADRAGGVVRKARLVATVRMPDGSLGRIAGALDDGRP